jgi:hypothetical protein
MALHLALIMTQVCLQTNVVCIFKYVAQLLSSPCQIIPSPWIDVIKGRDMVHGKWCIIAGLITTFAKLYVLVDLEDAWSIVAEK